jgi:ribosome recycling factor
LLLSLRGLRVCGQLTKAVSKAISDFNSDFHPDEDAKGLIVEVPKPSESNRKEIIQLIHNRTESSKIHLKRLHNACFKKLGNIEMPIDDRHRWESDVTFQMMYLPVEIFCF